MDGRMKSKEESKDPGPEDPALGYPWKGIILNSAIGRVGVME